MEGYLIRLPTCAWNVDDDAPSATKPRGRRSRRSCPPQARLLYYVLGEGFLEAFASRDDVEPVESFPLTSFEVDVDPVFSMLMFKVTTREKARTAFSPSDAPNHLTSESSDDDDDDDDDDDPRGAGHSTRPSSSSAAGGSSLMLFAANKSLVELWCRKILNWNRYVFAGPPADVGQIEPVQAKHELIAAFHEKNNQGMFSIFCQLVDCTTPPPIEVTHSAPVAERVAPAPAPADPTVVEARSTVPLPPLISPSSNHEKLQQDDRTKPVRTEIKPLRMLLHRGSSRRIRSVPMTQ